MRIACLQHVPFEGPAFIGTWAAARGLRLAITRLFASEPPPPLATFDALVVLGGPMSVNDEDRFSWLGPEKHCVRRAVDHGKPVIGICLGAQVIASALGARVVPSNTREVGWFSVKRTCDSKRHPAVASLPPEFTAFHWHGETAELPPSSIHLAGSSGCANQAFSIGQHVLALQFHLEATQEGVDALIQNCPGDLAPGPFVQTPDTIRSAHAHFQESNRLMATLLDAFLCGEHGSRLNNGLKADPSPRESSHRDASAPSA